MRKLRLLITADCDRACPGCCNNDWNLNRLPLCGQNDLEGFDEIVITGGEPMLKWDRLLNLFEKIPEGPKVFLYSAKPGLCLAGAMEALDGVTITLHEQADVEAFVKFQPMQNWYDRCTSKRLNVFAGIDLAGVNLAGWIVKDGIEWIEDCPLPNDEVFMKWSG